MKYPTEDLKKYMSHFPEGQRETVLRALLENDIIKRALDTTEGKILLGSVVDLIAEKTMAIVKACVANPVVIVEQCQHSALQINVAYNLLLSWATILDKGKKHEEGIG